MRYISWLTNNNYFKVWAALAIVVILVDASHTANSNFLNFSYTAGALIGHLGGAGLLALIFELLRWVFTSKPYKFQRYPRFMLGLGMVMEVQALIQIIQNRWYY